MMPDVMKLEIEEGRGDQYQMDSGADPEDNDKDTALLLSVREEDLEQEDTSDE
jgi:hypothetical protein